MSFALASFAIVLLQAINIYDRVMGRDGLIQRPAFASKAIARRLRAGVRALEAYLRRVLIVMALAIEPELVAIARPENLARAKPKLPCRKRYCLRIYPADCPADHHGGAPDFGPAFFRDAGAYSEAPDSTQPAVGVPIGHWLYRLDCLHAIAKDPAAKARRLAFSLARRRHGILMAPDEDPRLLRRWGTQASAIFDAMAAQIMHQSRLRPPPLPPPRNGAKPTITRIW